MNLKYLLWLPAVFLAQALLAQNTLNGLYITYNDYVKHKLTYSEGNDDITLNDFLETKYINVSTGSKKVRLVKDSVYGFRKNSQDYRFFQNKIYKITDTIGFYLYAREKTPPTAKSSRWWPVNFFSVSGNGNLSVLTVQNINKSFARDHQFKYMIDAQFKSDAELMEYDPAEKQYKIKEIYNDSRKK